MAHARPPRAIARRLRVAGMLATVLPLVSAALPTPSPALTVTEAECVEGADFIRNAARSRDNGMSSEAFLDRLEGDLVAIRAFAPSLRWFARDADDEALLRTAARSVFTHPHDPESHHRAFLVTCRAALAAAGGR